MDPVDFTIALTQATRMGTEDLVLPDGRGARGRMTADATYGGEAQRWREPHTVKEEIRGASCTAVGDGHQSAFLRVS